MADIETSRTDGSIPDLDVPEILRVKFDLLCEQVTSDIISAVEYYESDERVGSIDPCYELARFNRREWDERKLEKNLRRFLAREISPDDATVAPYEAELGPEVLFLDIASVKVPRIQEKGHVLGYTINLFRVTDEFSVDPTSDVVRPDVVTYKIAFTSFVDRLEGTCGYDPVDGSVLTS